MNDTLEHNKYALNNITRLTQRIVVYSFEILIKRLHENNFTILSSFVGAMDYGAS